jgi:glycosyltransferase involved in cell wall biosynthesis
MKRVAIVHDWLSSYAGSERVLEQLLIMYPTADLFAVCDFLSGDDRQFLRGREPKTTFIQRLPGARKHFRKYLPLMPLAIEQLDLSGYDVIISSSHAVAKGVLTGPDQLHVSYVHSPIRYAWDMQHQYLRESGLESGMMGWIARLFLHKMRLWDDRTANGVDVFLANSSFIGRRIRKVYGRESMVVYPPVDIDSYAPGVVKDDFYLTASRMVPYKRMDLIVEAFTRMPKRSLVVIGDGPERAKLEKIAEGHSNISLLGYQPHEVLVDHMRRAKAFVFAAEEDFGITPVEAQACGTPVIAYGKGGALETVIDVGHRGATGIFFDEQTLERIIQTVTMFDSANISSDDCRANAEKFSASRFRQTLSQIVDDAWSSFSAGCRRTNSSIGIQSDVPQ